jgi:hypothetical protein
VLPVPASMQVSQDRQWLLTKRTTNDQTRNHVLQQSVQPCSRKCSSLAETKNPWPQAHNLKSEVMHLYRRQQAACALLATDIQACVEVSSLYFLHQLYPACDGLFLPFSMFCSVHTGLHDINRPFIRMEPSEQAPCPPSWKV